MHDRPNPSRRMTGAKANPFSNSENPLKTSFNKL